MYYIDFDNFRRIIAKKNTTVKDFCNEHNISYLTIVRKKGVCKVSYQTFLTLTDALGDDKENVIVNKEV